MKLNTILFSFALLSFAQNASSTTILDAASASVYDDGWQTGDNGGSGWGAWSLNGLPGQFVTGDSASNGAGDTAAPVGDINSPLDLTGRAWGISGNAQAYRPFGNIPAVGQTITFDFDTGTIPDGYVEIDIRMPGHYWTLLYSAGNPTYGIYDTTGFHDTGIAFTDQGLHIEFTLVTADTYAAAITALGSAPVAFTGTFTNDSNVLSGLLLGSSTTGLDNTSRSYLNTIQIIPEPNAALFFLGAAALVSRRGRRRS